MQCKTLTCPTGQECFAVNPKGPLKKIEQIAASELCMIDVPVRKKCKTFENCFLAHKGVACRDGKCWAPPPSQKVNEICDPVRPCVEPFSCYKFKCKRNKGDACSSSDECPAVPCTQGKCRKANLGETCAHSRDCNNEDVRVSLYCSPKDKVCKRISVRGEPCDEDAGCNYTRGKITQSCLQGKCQALGYGRACETEGAVCSEVLLCELGKCRYKLQSGESCEYDSQCEIGLCEKGLCTTPGGGAGGCTNDADCTTGKICSDFGRCCKTNDDLCKGRPGR